VGCKLLSTNSGDTEVFPPQEGEELRQLTRQRPDLHGINRSRWRLTDLREVLPWLSGYSIPGVCQALRRLGVKRKQGRLSIHSPDPQYITKVGWIQRSCERAKRQPGQVVVLYADELSFYRTPELAGGGVYYPKGEEPAFPVPAGYNTRHRLGAAMDMLTGRVVWVEGQIVGVDALRLMLRKVRQAYGPSATIFVIWDNWPVHWHVDVLTAACELNIQLLWLPTYAPWLNPIEKMWRWLKQSVLHNHTLAHEFELLKEQVRTFLNHFADGSTDLLHYVGLLPQLTLLSC
jgi:transposase